MGQQNLLEKLKKTDIKDVAYENFNPEDLLESMKLNPEIITKRFTKLIEKNALRDIDLTVTSLNILFVVFTKGKTIQSDILEYVYTTPANLSQRIQSLKERNLIKVVDDDSDRRTKELILTQKGKQLTLEGLKASQEYKKRYTDYFTKEELIKYMEFNIKFSRLLDELEKE